MNVAKVLLLLAQGVDSPFFSAIVLFKNQPFPAFWWLSRKKDPWKEWKWKLALEISSDTLSDVADADCPPEIPKRSHSLAIEKCDLLVELGMFVSMLMQWPGLGFKILVGALGTAMLGMEWIAIVLLQPKKDEMDDYDYDNWFVNMLDGSD